MTQLQKKTDYEAIIRHEARLLPSYANYAEMITLQNALPVPKTLEDLIATDSRQFVYVAKTFGSPAIEKIIFESLCDTCRYMNMEVNGDMITKAAELISEQYFDCKLSDLKLFEKFMLTGKAGKLFRLDTPTLLEAFTKYYQERSEVFAAHRENEHLKRKKEIDNGELPTDERIKEVYKNMRLKAVEDYKGQKEYQEIKHLSAQEIVERNGHKYDEVLERHQEAWYDTWSKSGIKDEMPFPVFCGHRKNILDLQIKAGKEY